MLSTVQALELQANQLQLNLLSQMSLPGVLNSTTPDCRMMNSGLQFPKLDLVSLACGSAPNAFAPEFPGLLLPTLTQATSSPLGFNGMSSVVDLLCPNQPVEKPKPMSWVDVHHQAALSESLLAEAKRSFSALPQPTQQSPSHEDVDTEVEDSNSQDDDVEGETDVTIFPRRKQGQDKLGRNRPAIKITRQVLEQLFDIPQRQACKRLGICATVMKRVCRKLGVNKWPYKESMARKQGHMLNRIMSQSQ